MNDRNSFITARKEGEMGGNPYFVLSRPLFYRKNDVDLLNNKHLRAANRVIVVFDRRNGKYSIYPCDKNGKRTSRNTVLRGRNRTANDAVEALLQLVQAITK